MAKVKKRHSNYLDRLEPLIFQAADKAGIDRDEAKELIDEYFLHLQRMLTDARLPKVIIPGFGSLSVPMTAIRYLLTRKIKQFKKGTYSRFETSRGINRLWKPYKRKIAFKKNKTSTQEWHKVDPEVFKESILQGLYTNLPSDYYQMDHKKWFQFIKKEPRFDVYMPKNRKLSVLYNSLKGRLINIDRIKNIEKTLTAKGFDTFKSKQGRRSQEEEQMGQLVWAILNDNFDWDNRKIINENEFEEYDRKSIR